MARTKIIAMSPVDTLSLPVECNLNLNVTFGDIDKMKNVCIYVLPVPIRIGDSQSVTTFREAAVSLKGVLSTL